LIRESLLRRPMSPSSRNILLLLISWLLFRLLFSDNSEFCKPDMTCYTVSFWGGNAISGFLFWLPETFVISPVPLPSQGRTERRGDRLSKFIFHHASSASHLFSPLESASQVGTAKVVSLCPSLLESAHPRALMGRPSPSVPMLRWSLAVDGGVGWMRNGWYVDSPYK
jgi:hypothetical protein